eukprot:GHVQ01025309.1.p2 GENE.GHVQ01025309.1~~GHVQ01025309.1.p2  ORF type:complete len:120 (+),score=21.82 GHVQ01025309.1:355-714(+)
MSCQPPSLPEELVTPLSLTVPPSQFRSSFLSSRVGVSTPSKCLVDAGVIEMQKKWYAAETYRGGVTAKRVRAWRTRENRELTRELRRAKVQARSSRKKNEEKVFLLQRNTKQRLRVEQR